MGRGWKVRTALAASLFFLVMRKGRGDREEEGASLAVTFRDLFERERVLRGGEGEGVCCATASLFCCFLPALLLFFARCLSTSSNDRGKICVPKVQRRKGRKGIFCTQNGDISPSQFWLLVVAHGRLGPHTPPPLLCAVPCCIFVFRKP